MNTETLKVWLDLVEGEEPSPQMCRVLAADRTRRHWGEDEATNPIAAFAERNGGVRWER